MIRLRQMRDDEYPAYLDYFIPDYAADIASNYGLSESASIAQAQREVAADLPEGVKTSGQVMLCVVDQSDASESLLGYLWYKPDAETRSAFIYDFHILAAHQGKGLAKQALAVLESDLKAKGFERIGLRVAADNARARHVYDVTGFRVTGVNMSKSIGSA